MESRRLRLSAAVGRSSSSLSTTSSTSSSIMSDMIAARYHRRSRANRTAVAAGDDDDSSFMDTTPRTWICTDQDLNRPYNAARPCSSKQDSRPTLSLLASRNAKNLMNTLDDVTGEESVMSETTVPPRMTTANMMTSEPTTTTQSSSTRRHQSSRSSTTSSRTTRGRRKKDNVVSVNEHELEGGRFVVPPPAMTPMFGANVDTKHDCSMSTRPTKPRSGRGDTIPVPPSRSQGRRRRHDNTMAETTRATNTTTTSRDILIALDTVPVTAKTRFDPFCATNVPDHAGRKWTSEAHEPEYAKPLPSLPSRRLDAAARDNAKSNSNYTVYPMEASSMRSLYSAPRTLDAVFSSSRGLQRHDSRSNDVEIDDIDDDDSDAQSVRLALEEQENEMFMLALELSIHESTTDSRRRHDDATVSDMDSDWYLTDSDDEFW